MGARSTTPSGSLRQRNVGTRNNPADSNSNSDVEIDKLAKAASQKKKTTGGSERDHQLALTIVTILAFVTRFWGISHPNEVVFDEVHFGKVSMHQENRN